MRQGRAPSAELVRELRAMIGRQSVVTKASGMRRFVTGYRSGTGSAAAVVRPDSLIAFWRTLQVCHGAGAIVLVQAANTGLTGGSTPNGDYDRPVVVINTMLLKGIYPINGGEQVICLAGSTLNELENVLRPLGREPHSVIGSSCIGASVVGGVCNNSGGALIQRGPAYTELSMFASVGQDDQLRLVNHLGLSLDGDMENAFNRLERGDFPDGAILNDANARASARDYAQQVRHIDAETPARFNAEPSRLFEAAGSAGKIAVFAVRLDTFPAERRSATYYIGSNSVAELSSLRRDMLSQLRTLPTSCEYIHRDAFDIAATYGKDTFIAIEKLGTHRLPRLFAAKDYVDGLARRVSKRAGNLSDRLLQTLSHLFPRHLPERMLAFRDRFEHHLILKMGNAGIEEAERLLARRFPTTTGAYFLCDAEEAHKAFLHRFAVAGAAVRFEALHGDQVGGLLALDVALPRRQTDWFEMMPSHIEKDVLHRLYYGHFFCYVFHHDYLVKKGVNPAHIKRELLTHLDAIGAEYPAEHNVGHSYIAKAPLAKHYAELDPCNMFNPGIGGTRRDRVLL